MIYIVIIVTPILLGAGLCGCALSYLFLDYSQKRGTPLFWPGLLFLSLIGIALSTFSIAWYECAPFICYTGGFLSNLEDIFFSLLIALFALPGTIQHRTTISLCVQQPASSSLYYFWAWLLTQGALSLTVFFQDLWLTFPAIVLLLFSCFLFIGILGAGAFWGYRWGHSHRSLFPLLFLLSLSGMILFLIGQMSQMDLPLSSAAGICSPGFWYGRLCLPSIVLLDWFYPFWERHISSLLLPVIFFSLLPHVLFTAAYLFPSPIKRGYDYVKHHLKN